MPKSLMHHKASSKKFEFARMLRREQTEAEQSMWQFLRNKNLGVKFRRQHPLDKFVADFFCFERKLIVEIDGGYHDLPDEKAKDDERTKVLNALGYKVIRFKNEEVLNNLKGVLDTLKQEITKLEKA